MAQVDWVWIGKGRQINVTDKTPVSQAEAERVGGHTAVGNKDITAVTVSGNTYPTHVNGQQIDAFSTTYSVDSQGRDIAASQMTYTSPLSGQPVETMITGLVSVRYELTFLDGQTTRQDGELIQMKNGDLFFRPSADALP